MVYFDCMQSWGLSKYTETKIKTLSKVFGISSATVWVGPDLLKALAILSDETVR